MSRSLYAVLSNKRGVLYSGSNEEEYNNAFLMGDVSDEEGITSYVLKKMEDFWFLEIIRKREHRVNRNSITLDEGFIQALKGFL